MITGTIQNAVKLNMLTQKWEQKKSSGNVLSKQERNEQANWTPEQRMLNDYHEQLENHRESSKRAIIANKISSGQTLTPEEEQYMATYDPQGLADYKQTQSERKAYEEKLKNCKTKDEVQRLKTTTLGMHLASLKKIINDPLIPLNEKLTKAQQILGKTKNVQAIEEDFIESGKFDELPTEAEQALERVENTKAEKEMNNAVIEESVNPKEKAGSDEVEEKTSADKAEVNTKAEKNQIYVKTEIPKETESEIKEIFDYLRSSQKPQAGTDNKILINNKKTVGKTVDFSV